MRLVEPDWFGKLSGFTLLFEALILILAQQMTFRGISRLVGVSVHRIMAICNRYVSLAVAEADYIVTCNIKHFNKPYRSTKIITARQLLTLLTLGEK